MNFFVYDVNHAFRSKNVWFRTKVKRQGLYKTYVNSDDHFLQCLVIPFQDQSKKAVGLILEEHIAFPTHRIRLGDGVECDARLMVKIRGTNDLVDPFAFRYGKMVSGWIIVFKLTLTFAFVLSRSQSK